MTFESREHKANFLLKQNREITIKIKHLLDQMLRNHYENVQLYKEKDGK